jgi:hypothetical protein
MQLSLQQQSLIFAASAAMDEKDCLLFNWRLPLESNLFYAMFITLPHCMVEVLAYHTELQIFLSKAAGSFKVTNAMREQSFKVHTNMKKDMQLSLIWSKLQMKKL